MKLIAVILASLLLCSGCGGSDGSHPVDGAGTTGGNTTTTPPAQPGSGEAPPSSETPPTSVVPPVPQPGERVLVRLEIAPATNRLWAGTDRQLMATGTYADGVKADLTPQADWRSSDTTVATVVRGMVVARAPGSAEITATFGAVTGTALLTVPPIPVPAP